jgi:hypothetical protein
LDVVTAAVVAVMVAMVDTADSAVVADSVEVPDSDTEVGTAHIIMDSEAVDSECVVIPIGEVSAEVVVKLF